MSSSGRSYITSTANLGVDRRVFPIILTAIKFTLFSLSLKVLCVRATPHTIAPHTILAFTTELYAHFMYAGFGPHFLLIACFRAKSVLLAYLIFSSTLAAQINLWSNWTPRYLTLSPNYILLFPITRRFGLSSSFILALVKIMTYVLRALNTSPFSPPHASIWFKTFCILLICWWRLFPMKVVVGSKIKFLMIRKRGSFNHLLLLFFDVPPDSNKNKNF